MRLINKRGQVGIETAKAVMLALLVLGVIGFTLILLLANLNDTSVAQTSSGSLRIENETLATVSELGENLFPANLPDASCTINEVLSHNASTQGVHVITGTTNVTATDGNCNLAFGGADGREARDINNTDWNVTYTYTYNQFSDVSQNITTGSSDFFGNATTWFALLAVVVIILIIAIVVFAVNRFGGNRVVLG